MNSRSSLNSLWVRGMSPSSVLESEHPSRSSVKSPNRTGAPRGGNERLIGALSASSVSSPSATSIPTADVGDCYSTVTPRLLDYQTFASGVWKNARVASLGRRWSPLSRRRRENYEVLYYRAGVWRRAAGFSVRPGRADISGSHRASSGRRPRLAGIYGGL